MKETICLAVFPPPQSSAFLLIESWLWRLNSFKFWGLGAQLLQKFSKFFNEKSTIKIFLCQQPFLLTAKTLNSLGDENDIPVQLCLHLFISMCDVIPALWYWSMHCGSIFYWIGEWMLNFLYWFAKQKVLTIFQRWLGCYARICLIYRFSQKACL